MHPILDFGLFQVSAYSFFTAVALAAAVTGSYFFALKRGFKKNDILWMALGMGLSVFIGARLMNIAVNFDWYAENPPRAWALSATGFSLYGGILAAVLTGGLISVRHKIPLLKFADTVTPFTGLGIALMRIGCFLNGCCFGKETDLPWGVTYPPFSPAHIHQLSGNLLGGIEVRPVHPTQIYELIVALACTALAFYLIKKKKPHGTAFLWCGILFSAFRWFNMNLRELPYDETLTAIWYPVLYLSVIALCSLMLAKIEIKKDPVWTPRAKSR